MTRHEHNIQGSPAIELAMMLIDFYDSMSVLRGTVEHYSARFEGKVKELDYNTALAHTLLAVQKHLDPQNICVRDRLLETLNGTPSQDNCDVRISKMSMHVTSLHHENSLIFGGFVLNLVRNLEGYLVNLLYHAFSAHPERLSQSQVTFSLEMIRSFEDMKEAERHFVTQEVEKITRKGHDAVLTFFRKDAGLKAPQFNHYQNELNELFQRRNVIAHNNGIINDQYRNSLRGARSTLPMRGAFINVTKDYIDKAISIIEKCHIQLGFELWHKLHPKDETRYEVIADILYECLCDKRYDLLDTFYKILEHDKSCPDKSRLSAEVNNCLGLKERGADGEQLRKLIRRLERFSGDMPKLVKAILLGAHEEAIRLVERLIGDGALDRSDLEDWPLFVDIRHYPMFLSLCERMPTPKPKIRGIDMIRNARWYYAYSRLTQDGEGTALLLDSLVVE